MASRRTRVIWGSTDPTSCQRAKASALKTDLANGTAPPFIWLTPNLCNDVHDCSNETSDNYLRGLMPSILASKWYGEDGTVILTFDEDTGENKRSRTPTNCPGSAARRALPRLRR
ncbi:MAG: hypothetical protein E6I95_16105 [Chloroflexi bacterium]|nr:MAG: hypothetical protein E6I95_16105 [Chloroflexota bacterium]